MVREFICPDHIADLFDDEKTQPKGRGLALEWVEGLDLREGDRVWMSGVGWTEKETGIQ